MKTFFYKKLGKGPAVILLHGFPECSTLWRNIWDELAENFTVIVPDLPGSGATVLEAPVGIEDMAKGIKQVIDKERLERVVIAGHSMGGYVAFAFADLFPGKVMGISAVHSTTAADGEERKKLRLKSIELINKVGKEIFIENMVPNLFSKDFKQSNVRIVEDQVQESLKMSGESIVNFYNAMLERNDYTRILDTTVFPLQWIMGAQDSVLPYKKTLEKCHRSAINFLSFYENCGHMSMLEAPAQLAADLKIFVNYCYDR